MLIAHVQVYEWELHTMLPGMVQSHVTVCCFMPMSLNWLAMRVSQIPCATPGTALACSVVQYQGRQIELHLLFISGCAQPHRLMYHWMLNPQGQVYS